MTHTRVFVITVLFALAMCAASLAGIAIRSARAQQPPASAPKVGDHGHKRGNAAHGDHEHPPIPAAYANTQIPPGVWTDPKMIAKGKEIYIAKCALCHGEKGDGKGPGSVNLPLKPADLTDGKMVAEMAGNFWVWRVTEGGLVEPFKSKGSAMPAWNEDGVRQASETHPDLRTAIKQREATQAEVRAAYGNYFPQVSLSYMYDGQWSKNRNEASTTADGYSVGVVVTLPLFDGFQREHAVNTAKARLDRATQAEGLVRQQITKEVNQAALMLTAAETSVEASRKGLEQAEEEFRVMKERFASGRGIQLEILDAQVSLTRARFNAVAALAEYNSAQAMWLRATGRVR